MMSGGEVEIIGLGVAESQGIRRGAVVNLEAAVESIRKAVEEAELTAGIEIDNVVPRALGHAHQGLQQPRRRGRGRQEPRDHPRRRAAGHRGGAGRQPAGGPRDPPRAAPGLRRRRRRTASAIPSGMTGSRLEVNVHIVTGGTTTTQNIVACVNRAGVTVQEPVLEQLAASEAVLTPDEKELGVALRRHRRRDHRPRHLRARQPVAHRGRRRSAATTSPTTSPSACGCPFPRRRS